MRLVQQELRIYSLSYIQQINCCHMIIIAESKIVMVLRKYNHCCVMNSCFMNNHSTKHSQVTITSTSKALLLSRRHTSMYSTACSHGINGYRKMVFYHIYARSIYKMCNCHYDSKT